MRYVRAFVAVTILTLFSAPPSTGASVDPTRAATGTVSPPDCRAFQTNSLPTISRAPAALRDAAWCAAASAIKPDMANVELRDVVIEPERITLEFGPLPYPFDVGTAQFEDEINHILGAIGGAVLPELPSLEFEITFDGTPLRTLLARERPHRPVVTTAPTASASTPLVAVSAGHGLYWNGSAWVFQRDYYWGIVEDLVTRDFALGVESRLTSLGASVLLLREPNKSAGNGESAYPKWQEAARYYLKSQGVPSSIWNFGYASQRDDDIMCRPTYANYRNANVLVSIHTNGGGGTGTETYYDTTNAFSTPSKDLATAIHTKVISSIRANYNASWPDRGVKGSPGSRGEIREATRPAALIEIAFHDTQNARQRGHSKRHVPIHRLSLHRGCDGRVCRDREYVCIRSSRERQTQRKYMERTGEFQP